MSESICDVTERLFAEFEHVHPLSAVTAAVLRARHDLRGSPEAALPELVERLVRYRLTEAVRHHDPDTAACSVTESLVVQAAQ
jgi:hypothetical protein